MRLETSPSTDFPVARVQRGRPLALYPLLVLIGVLSIAGLAGGWSLMADRTGDALQADLSWLEGTPVSDFLLPGVFLFLVYGVFGLILIAGLWTRRSFGPLTSIDERTGLHWSWWGAVAIGSVLVAWIVYELFVIPDVIWLQPALAAVGFTIIVLAMLPSVRAYGHARSRPH
ncbi:MAG: hypothetical protein WB297_13575 [Actinomycetota bacterium]